MHEKMGSVPRLQQARPLRQLRHEAQAPARGCSDSVTLASRSSILGGTAIGGRPTVGGTPASHTPANGKRCRAVCACGADLAISGRTARRLHLTRLAPALTARLSHRAIGGCRADQGGAARTRGARLAGVGASSVSGARAARLARHAIGGRRADLGAAGRASRPRLACVGNSRSALAAELTPRTVRRAHARGRHVTGHEAVGTARLLLACRARRTIRVRRARLASTGRTSAHALADIRHAGSIRARQIAALLTAAAALYAGACDGKSPRRAGVRRGARESAPHSSSPYATHLRRGALAAARARFTARHRIGAAAAAATAASPTRAAHAAAGAARAGEAAVGGRTRAVG